MQDTQEYTELYRILSHLASTQQPVELQTILEPPRAITPFFDRYDMHGVHANEIVLPSTLAPPNPVPKRKYVRKARLLLEGNTPDVPPTPSSRRSKCTACYKWFPNKEARLLHQTDSVLCAEWMATGNKDKPVTEHIHNVIHDLLHDAITGPLPYQCRFCSRTFSNKGNQRKHLHDSIICNRFAYMEFKKKVLESM